MPTAAHGEAERGWTQTPHGWWPLLLPAAYLLHLAEEVWGGRGLVPWAVQHLSPSFTFERFLTINAVGLPALLVAMLAAIRVQAARWFIAAVATLLLLNGLVHAAASLVTGTYAPGAVTGLLLYVPLGGWALRRVAAEIEPARLAVGVVCGIGLHAIVALAAFVPGAP